jgi:hypothetical protein
MCAKAEQPQLAGLFHGLGPGFQTGIHIINASDAMHRKKVNVIGMQPFQARLEPGRKIGTSSK